MEGVLTMMILHKPHSPKPLKAAYLHDLFDKKK